MWKVGDSEVPTPELKVSSTGIPKMYLFPVGHRDPHLIMALLPVVFGVWWLAPQNPYFSYPLLWLQLKFLLPRAALDPSLLCSWLCAGAEKGDTEAVAELEWWWSVMRPVLIHNVVPSCLRPMGGCFEDFQCPSPFFVLYKMWRNTRKLLLSNA